MNIKYLNHNTFIRVIQWTLIEAVEGSYLHQYNKELSYIAETKRMYGYITKEHMRDLNELRAHWATPAYFSKFVCVDISTGEVYEPC